MCVCVGGGGSWSWGHAKDCFEFEIHDFGLFLVRTLANFFGGGQYSLTKDSFGY